MSSNELSKPTSGEKKKCEICDIKDSKYTCSRCNLSTCSLICNNQHKQKHN